MVGMSEFEPAIPAPEVDAKKLGEKKSQPLLVN
jgi:hypothetical protein